jgi:chromosome segregation ATPase
VSEEPARNGATEQGEGIRERVASRGEEALGKLAQDLLENPWINSALSAAFEARGKASQAQEVAMDFLNLPSASQMERLTRRVRSLSQRLEAIEESLKRIEDAVQGGPSIAQRLSAIEAQLDELGRSLGERPQAADAPPPGQAH